MDSNGLSLNDLLTEKLPKYATVVKGCKKHLVGGVSQ